MTTTKPNLHINTNAFQNKRLIDQRNVQVKKVQNQPFLPTNIDSKKAGAEVIALKSKLKKYDTFAAAVSVSGLVIAFVENEIFFTNNHVSQLSNYILRSIVLLTCLLSTLFILKHYQIELSILKCRRFLHQNSIVQLNELIISIIVISLATLIQSPLLLKFILEIIVNWIFCPPGLDTVINNYELGITFELSLDEYILFLMYSRLYVLFRLFDHYTIWTDPRAERVCKMNGFTADSKFAIKAYLKYRSFWVLSIGLGLSVFLFGLWVRIFERPFVTSARAENFNFIWNSFWCIIVTMTTIGYGDIYAKTHLGRFVSIGACIWGVFLLSLLVVILNNYTEMSKEESYEELVREEKIRNKLRKEAAIVIQTQYRLRLLRKKRSADYKERLLKRIDLMGTVNRFRIKRKYSSKRCT